MESPVPIPDALVRAAIQLAAEQPPTTIRGRRLAEAAGVNYGHVHHYFGGVAGVLRAAFALLVDTFVAELPDAVSSTETGPRSGDTSWLDRELLWRSLASFAGDPTVLKSMSWDYPRMRGAVERVAGEHSDVDIRQVRLRLAMGSLVALGWMGYRQFVTDALDLSQAELAELESWVGRSQVESWTFGDADDGSAPRSSPGAVHESDYLSNAEQ